MSAIVALPILLPAAPVVWPVLAAAAVAAASAMGFAASKAETDVQTNDRTSVDVDVPNAEAVTDGMASGQQLTLVRDDVQVQIGRDQRGAVFVRVSGDCARSKAELEEIGKELTSRIVQQYAYHRLVTELKQRDINIVDETVEEDGTVRLHVRTYQG